MLVASGLCPADLAFRTSTSARGESSSTRIRLAPASSLKNSNMRCRISVGSGLIPPLETKEIKVFSAGRALPIAIAERCDRDSSLLQFFACFLPKFIHRFIVHNHSMAPAQDIITAVLKALANSLTV